MSGKNFGIKEAKEEAKLEARREACKAWNILELQPCKPPQTQSLHPKLVASLPVCCRNSCFSGWRSIPIECMFKACMACPGPKAIWPRALDIAPQHPSTKAKLLSCLERGWRFASGKAAARRGPMRASRSSQKRSRQAARLPTAAVACPGCSCCSCSACSPSHALQCHGPLISLTLLLSVATQVSWREGVTEAERSSRL